MIVHPDTQSHSPSYEPIGSTKAFPRRLRQRERATWFSDLGLDRGCYEQETYNPPVSSSRMRRAETYDVTRLMHCISLRKLLIVSTPDIEHMTQKPVTASSLLPAAIPQTGHKHNTNNHLLPPPPPQNLGCSPPPSSFLFLLSSPFHGTGSITCGLTRNRPLHTDAFNTAVLGGGCFSRVSSCCTGFTR